MKNDSMIKLGSDAEFDAVAAKIREGFVAFLGDTAETHQTIAQLDTLLAAVRAKGLRLAAARCRRRRAL